MAKRRPAYDDVPPSPEMRGFHAVAAKEEPRMARAFSKLARSLWNKETEKRVLRALGDPSKTIEDAVQEFDWFNPADPLSVKQWELYTENLARIYADTIERAGNVELRELGLDDEIRFEVQKAAKKIAVPPNPFSIRWIRERAAANVTAINLQQQQIVRAAIEEGLEQGLRDEAIAQRLSRNIGLTGPQAQANNRRFAAVLSETGSERTAAGAAKRYAEQQILQRGRTIARTEIKEAISQGQSDSWAVADEAGALPPGTEKEWVSMPESPKLTDICRELDGQRVKVNEDFNSTIVGPVHAPPAHPNCRSTMVLHFPGER